MRNISETTTLHLPPSIHENTILEVVELTSNVFRIRFENESFSKNVLPGQFINIKVSNNLTPLWRRPFSIHDASPAEMYSEILFKVIGEGTELLSQMRDGQRLNFIGPLGNSFYLPEDDIQQAFIIAGGLGVAPFMMLCRQLKKRNVATHLFWGCKGETDFCLLDEFADTGVQLHLSAEDGSIGHKGFITELFEKEISTFNARENSIIYACGPNPMLDRVIKIATHHKLQCQVSLETLMACGLGACLGCGVKRNVPETSYLYVCKDGPVFASDEVILDE